jgi:hypothetical protein
LRRSPVHVIVGIAIAFLSVRARAAGGQAGSAGEGAPELLFPTGAAIMAMGQAAAADAQGAAAMWWNPALIGSIKKPELAYHFGTTFITDYDNTVSVVLPVSYVGSVGAAVRYIDYGPQESADELGPTGILGTRTLVTVMSFGAPLGRVSIGVSYKYLRQLYDCTGECIESPSGRASTSAIDLGMRTGFSRQGHAVSVGASVLNLGRALQVKDAPQADPLPTRLQVGVAVAPKLAGMPPEASLRVVADVVTRLNSLGDQGYRAGAELGWQGRYQLRGGYALDSPAGSGFSIGFGVNTGKLQIDVARFLNDFSAGAVKPPTYVSLRYQF